MNRFLIFLFPLFLSIETFGDSPEEIGPCWVVCEQECIYKDGRPFTNFFSMYGKGSSASQAYENAATDCKDARPRKECKKGRPGKQKWCGDKSPRYVFQQMSAQTGDHVKRSGGKKSHSGERTSCTETCDGDYDDCKDIAIKSEDPRQHRLCFLGYVRCIEKCDEEENR